MRKPIELEIRGLQTPRERVWAAILKLRKGFDRLTVQDACNPMVSHHVADDYLAELEKAGFIKLVAKGKHKAGQPGAIHEAWKYDLVKEQFEAPRLNLGKPVTHGMGQLAMWRSMKVLQKGFNYLEVAQAASQEGLEVKPEAAKSYVNALARAGYFNELAKAKPGTPGRYRLAKNTGPHAPMITKRKCVFDRNTGGFAELQTAQEVCDALE